MRRIGIIGAGDLGVQLAHLVSLVPEMRAVGFFDDTMPATANVEGLPVLGGIDAVHSRFNDGSFDELVVGIGYKHMALRHELYHRFNSEIPFARLIHPRAWVDPSSTIGPGAVLYAGCIVDMKASIGPNALLNVGCVIAHHSSIGEGCFLSPGVSIAGFVSVGASTSLGIGTVVIDNVSIARGTRIGAGAVVVGNISEPGLYVGVPARLRRSE